MADEAVTYGNYLAVGELLALQRTIGAKVGTTGSVGAQYLVTTLMTPAFPNLWGIRSAL